MSSKDSQKRNRGQYHCHLRASKQPPQKAQKKRSHLRVWYSGLVPSVRLPVLAQSRRVVERTILMLPEDHEVVEEALFRLLVLLNLCIS